jgi:hypothetical protein
MILIYRKHLTILIFIIFLNFGSQDAKKTEDSLFLDIYYFYGQSLTLFIFIK